MPRTGAELLVESLVATGIKHLFTLSGNHVMPVFDATIGRDIALFHTRHEAAAVHMADAWGRLTGKPGVALVTAGPGHCNALSALYVALMAESPLVLLSGHAPLQRLGEGSFQEIDQVTMAKPVTKAAWLVKKVDDLERDLAKALKLANEGRPGPVHLSLPTDVLEATVPDSHVPGIPYYEGTENVSSSSNNGAIEEILNHLAAAKRPLILAGPAMGRSPRWPEVVELSNMLNIPALPMESPRGVNDPWLHFATNNLAETDLVLLLGKKMDFTLKFGQPPSFAPECRFVQIDADKSQLGIPSLRVWSYT